MKLVFKYTLLVLLILTVSVFLVEIGLGAFFAYKDRGLEPMKVKDYPYLYYIFEKGEITDDYGLKTDRPLQKPEGKFRILLTGGSVARGQGNKETISVYLEKELNERLHTDKIEVLNAGMSAYVVEQDFIFIQLVLQKYEPDMIVSLDGYNDLLTWKLNRFDKGPYPLAPHNWSQFQVIRRGQYNHTFQSRFTGFFKNITRAVLAMRRYRSEHDFNWNGITLSEKAEVSSSFSSVVDDTHKFCEAKQIDYFNFLQPIRFYHSSTDTSKLTPEQKGMNSIYNIMDLETLDKDYATSLTSLLKGHEDLFLDDCHVKPQGNQLIAKAMADYIEPALVDYLSPASQPERDTLTPVPGGKIL